MEVSCKHHQESLALVVHHRFARAGEVCLHQLPHFLTAIARKRFRVAIYILDVAKMVLVKVQVHVVIVFTMGALEKSCSYLNVRGIMIGEVILLTVFTIPVSLL